MSENFYKTMDGTVYVAKTGKSCVGCSLKGTGDCGTPPCSAENRFDQRDVIFVKTVLSTFITKGF